MTSSTITPNFIDRQISHAHDVINQRSATQARDHAERLATLEAKHTRAAHAILALVIKRNELRQAMSATPVTRRASETYVNHIIAVDGLNKEIEREKAANDLRLAAIKVEREQGSES